MFGFIHPKPYNQKAVAVQMVARKVTILPAVRVLIVEDSQEDALLLLRELEKGASALNVGMRHAF